MIAFNVSRKKLSGDSQSALWKTCMIFYNAKFMSLL